MWCVDLDADLDAPARRGLAYRFSHTRIAQRVLLAGHCDQIGLVVTYIDDKGYLYTKPIGGWDPQQLIGQRMTVWTAGGPIPAVIARKPIHLLKEEERNKVVKLEEMWLDIGARRWPGRVTRVDSERVDLHFGKPLPAGQMLELQLGESTLGEPVGELMGMTMQPRGLKVLLRLPKPQTQRQKLST